MKAGRSVAGHRLLPRSPSLFALILRACGCCLTTEAVEGLALALERVDDVEGRHGLAAGVLSVGHGVADDVLEEHLEDTAGLLVDEAGDALDTTTASEAADRGLLQRSS